jgi:glycosyltransferase involved in cell wall biosynthesis
MKLSVVIPTYNRRESLRRTLDGLTCQTFPPDEFEVIVVSDGSTDGTEAMLIAYAASVPFALRPITQANAGPSAARNRGIAEARHEVIVFLDDDVEPCPEFLARHAAYHVEDESVIVLGPMSPDPERRAEEPVWIAWEHAKLQEIYAMFGPGGHYAGVDAGPEHFYSGNASVRRRWLEAVGGFDVTYTRQEDVELAARLRAAFGLRFVFDFAANGLHRPSRTFDSWLRIPTSYGTLDAHRVLAGQLNEQDVARQAARRSFGTRALTRLCLAVPQGLSTATMILRSLAIGLHRYGMTRAALAALSGLYNATYAAAFGQSAQSSRAHQTGGRCADRQHHHPLL